MKQLLLKHLFFGLTMLLLVFPALQCEFSFFEEKPLTGAFIKPIPPKLSELTLASWFDGSYQDDFTTRLEPHIGFHNTLTRLFNQLEYSLFRQAHAEGVIVGKNGELFEEDYIRAYMGEFYVGEAVWNDKATKLKAVQDTLRKLGTSFFVILEPGKGSTYSDCFPTQYNAADAGISNYKVFSSQLKNHEVDYLDLSAVFQSWKHTKPYRLFPRAGTHWSYYGAALAADTMLQYLNQLHGGGIPQLEIIRLDENREIRHPDDDMWLAMNVLAEAPAENLAYPEIRFESVTAAKPKALFVGDSFYFNWQSDLVMYNSFSDVEFWYYNKIVWNRQGVEAGSVDDKDFAEAIAHADIIAIMITERFHHNFAWNLDEQLYDHFFTEEVDPIQYFANQVRINNLHFMRMVDDAKAKDMELTER
ncbi:MAG TPA: hypothetical protein PLC47_02755, partial [Bacteroidales bacterium]|nr:hypothetical protein [Bacteroidales bacterium]